MLKENLDKRICDAEETATNEQTYREYIRESENEFEIGEAKLDNMSEEQLNNYLNFMDDLWCK